MNARVLFSLSVCVEGNLTSSAVPGVEGEAKDYREQLKQMLQDLAKEKEKGAEKPLPLMNQVLDSAGLSLAFIINRSVDYF